MPEPGVAHRTVMDWRLQAFFFDHTGRTRAGSCWGNGYGHYAGSCSGSGSLSAAGSVAPSTAALVGAVCLDDDDEIHVHRRKLHREPCNSGRELCDGRTVTHCGRRQVCNGVDRLLLEVHVVCVCCDVVSGTEGGNCIVLN